MLQQRYLSLSLCYIKKISICLSVLQKRNIILRLPVLQQKYLIFVSVLQQRHSLCLYVKTRNHLFVCLCYNKDIILRLSVLLSVSVLKWRYVSLSLCSNKKISLHLFVQQWYYFPSLCATTRISLSVSLCFNKDITLCLPVLQRGYHSLSLCATTRKSLSVSLCYNNDIILSLSVL